LIWSELPVPDIYENDNTQINIPIRSENRIVDNILKWFSKYSMGAGERNNNLFKLAVAMNDYGVAKNVCESVCLNYQSKDFTAREIQTIVKSAYQKTASFGTKFFEDNFTKDKIEKAIRSGKDTKNIKKQFPELKESEFENAFENVKENISVTDFWEYCMSQKDLYSFRYDYQETTVKITITPETNIRQ